MAIHPFYSMLSSVVGGIRPSTPVTVATPDPPPLVIDESEELRITRADIVPPNRDAEIFALAQQAVPRLTRAGYDAALDHSVVQINSLHPEMRGPVTIGLRQLYAQGMPVIVNQGYRGEADQNRAFRQGFSNARYGDSFHNYGVAVDVVMINESGEPDFRGSPGFARNPRNTEALEYHQSRLDRSIATIRNVFCGDRDINDDGRSDAGRNVGVGLFHLGQGDPAHFQLLPGGGGAARAFADATNEVSERGQTVSVAYTALAEDVAAAIPEAVRRSTRTLLAERAVARQETIQRTERLQAREAQPEEPSPVTTLVAEVSHAANRGFAAVRNFFA